MSIQLILSYFFFLFFICALFRKSYLVHISAFDSIVIYYVMYYVDQIAFIADYLLYINMEHKHAFLFHGKFENIYIVSTSTWQHAYISIKNYRLI